MSRVKRGFISRRYHKKIIKSNSGYYGAPSKLFKVAKQENMRALRYSYVDRKKKKRIFRELWIKRINGLIRLINKSKYNTFINKLKIFKISINRKILAKIINKDPKTFIYILNF
uniref:Large ribosomal subunit protein bL20c n=1 Tax=Phacus pleuronectes TaxID=102908 RepID=A0A3G3LLX1_9EUGL|nr:ribosomal protein L20 [Phacus pleuronectes]AYQ93698.1 ribosomal protein L20 [Phacus pleuronectes]